MSAIDGVRPVSPISSVANVTSNNTVGAGVYRAARVASTPRVPVTAIDADINDTRSTRDLVDGPLSEQARQTSQTSVLEPDLEQVVSEANTSLEMSRRSMRFRISEETGDLQIQIVDREKDKVIRSIPSDEMLRISSRMRELFGVGSMVDTAR